jgi:hypothetical protein
MDAGGKGSGVEWRSSALVLVEGAAWRRWANARPEVDQLLPWRQSFPNVKAMGSFARTLG